MPTENRSSNTELSKIVTEALVGMVSGVTGMKPPPDEPLPSFIQAPIDRAVTRISGLLAQPAPQPHPEPIAWIVGTAFWWTKEEAERDAEATGLPIVGLGPMTDTSEVDRLVAANTEYARRHLENQVEVERLRAALKFYADREHYHFESDDWDSVSGEPLNILWRGEEPDFIEDGTVARGALERQS